MNGCNIRVCRKECRWYAEWGETTVRHSADVSRRGESGRTDLLVDTVFHLQKHSYTRNHFCSWKIRVAKQPSIHDVEELATAYGKSMWTM